MQIEVKLPDERFCDGCPCLHIQDEFATASCWMGFFSERGGWNNAVLSLDTNKVYPFTTMDEEHEIILKLLDRIDLKNLRPKECVEKFK